MANNVTDRLLLKKVYDVYYDKFCSFEINNPTRKSHNFVPIDCKLIGKELNIDGAIVFGRLYYHLDKKYGYKNDDGSITPLFYLKLGDDQHVINFPLLSAVLAELEQDYYRYMLPLIVSIGALAVSAVALGWSDFFNAMTGNN